jgi:hypothetical protein
MQTKEYSDSHSIVVGTNTQGSAIPSATQNNSLYQQRLSIPANVTLGETMSVTIQVDYDPVALARAHRIKELNRSINLGFEPLAESTSG